jgi:hypothetical protein
MQDTSALPGLSPVSSEALIARFDRGEMSYDGGLLALREIEAQLGVAGRLAACPQEWQAPERIRYSVTEMLHLRLQRIAADFEDGDGADTGEKSSEGQGQEKMQASTGTAPKELGVSAGSAKAWESRPSQRRWPRLLA